MSDVSQCSLDTFSALLDKRELELDKRAAELDRRQVSGDTTPCRMTGVT